MSYTLRSPATIGSATDMSGVTPDTTAGNKKAEPQGSGFDVSWDLAGARDSAPTLCANRQLAR